MQSARNQKRFLFLPHRELIEVLHSRGVAVYLISGGFHGIIEPIAKAVNVPKSNIFANRLCFYFNGKQGGDLLRVI